MNTRHILITALAGISLSACNFVPHVIQARIDANPVECPVTRCPAEQPSQPATPLTADEIHAFRTPPAPQAPGPEPLRFAQPPAPQAPIDDGRP